MSLADKPLSALQESDLLDLIGEIEGKTIEFKREVGKKDEERRVSISVQNLHAELQPNNFIEIESEPTLEAELQSAPVRDGRSELGIEAQCEAVTPPQSASLPRSGHV